jgi:RNA ligase (TIGR02306 family)
MERKLASLQKVNSLTPIEGADSLELAGVLGWKTVVKKQTFKVGDFCIWLEVDSWVPTDIAPFLTKSDHFPKEFDGVKGERLKTCKLRGALSQGLLLPVIATEEGKLVFDTSSTHYEFKAEEGTDLTETLGIQKWEPPIPAQLAGQVKGMFPAFIRKTDQERIQNLTEFFHVHRDKLFEVSIKLDGSSMTVYNYNTDFGVCSRNLDLKEDESNSFWKKANELNLREELAKIGRNLAIQGELIGEGIQGNPEKIKGQELYVFDIWDIDKRRYLTAPERKEVLGLIPQLKSVPILHEAYQVFVSHDTMEKILWFAGSGPSLNAAIREGLVFKSVEVEGEEVISFKAINNQYLLSHGG